MDRNLSLVTTKHDQLSAALYRTVFRILYSDLSEIFTNWGWSESNDRKCFQDGESWCWASWLIMGIWLGICCCCAMGWGPSAPSAPTGSGSTASVGVDNWRGLGESAIVLGRVLLRCWQEMDPSSCNWAAHRKRSRFRVGRVGETGLVGQRGRSNFASHRSP